MPWKILLDNVYGAVEVADKEIFRKISTSSMLQSAKQLKELAKLELPKKQSNCEESHYRISCPNELQMTKIIFWFER